MPARRKKQAAAASPERSRRHSPPPSPPRPSLPPCELKSLTWASMFGLDPRSVRSPEGRRDLCRAVSAAIPLTARAGYRVFRLVNRGAYGVVFAAHNPRARVPWAALKVQFVCPKEVKRSEDRARCGAFGQRASPYAAVRYEAMQHARVHGVLVAAAANPAMAGRALPSVPVPLGATRMLVGRRGQYPGVPPDGRRRLWVSLMEFMSGRSVRQAMQDARRRGTLTPEAFAGVCMGVADHLRAFHELGFAHGDLHTGNVLVDEERAAAGRPWVILVDLERSIPRDFFEEAPLGALGLRAETAEERERLWDVARVWDLKIFVESAVRLAESVGAHRPSTARPDSPAGAAAAAATSRSSRHSSASPTPPRERFRRGVGLALQILSSYARTDAGASAWFLRAANVWTARALWLRRHPSAELPAEVLEELAPVAAPEGRPTTRWVAAVDRHDHRAFFGLLRAVQGFYTTPARSGPRRRLEGLDPALILPQQPSDRPGRTLRPRK
jgi:hypothetical protein